MKKKHIFKIICTIVLVASIFLGIYEKYFIRDSMSTYGNADKNLSQRDYNVIRIINTYKEPSGLYSTVSGLENTKSSYNTIYYNLIFNELGLETDPKIINYLKEQKFFINNDKDVLNDIEKNYYVNILNKNNSSDIKQYIKDNLIQIIKSDYHSEGYFLSNQFAEFKDKPDFIFTKLNNTLEVLELAKQFDLMGNIDIQKIKLWLNAILLDKNVPNLPSKLYYISNCFNALNSPLNVSSNDIIIDQKLFNSIDDISSLIEIEHYLGLCKQYSVKISISEIEVLKNNLLISFNKKSNDPQIVYRKIQILKDLDKNFMSQNEKSDLEFLIRSDQFEDGFFPDVSQYPSDFKQTYLYVSTLLFLNHDSDVDKKSIKQQIANLSLTKLDNLCKSDIFEIYSIVQLNNILDLDALNKDMKNTIIQALLNIDIKEVNENNLLVFLRKTITLKGLGYKFTKSYFPSNTNSILNSISNNDSIFKHNKVFDIFFLDTLFNAGYSKAELSKFAKYVDDIEVDKNDELSTTLIYYKYVFLSEIDFKFDKDKMYQLLADSETNIGYGLNFKSQLFDPRATFFCEQLKFIVERKRSNLDELR